MSRYDEIMDELVAYRRQSGLTQQQVADRVHMSRDGVAVFENRGGPKNPRVSRLDVILRYAHAIGADLEVVTLGGDQ